MSKYNILIVDDEEYILELMSDALEHEDYKILRVSSCPSWINPLVYYTAILS